MAVSVVTSDQAGTIYAIDNVGELFRNRQRNPNGTGPLVEPGFGTRVGSGWDSVFPLAATPLEEGAILAGIKSAGIIATSTQHTAATTATAVDAAEVPAPKALEFDRKGAPNFAPSQVWGGPGGWLYMISDESAFARVKVRVDGSEVGADPIEIIAPEGWGNSIALFVNDDHVWFEVAVDGTLRCQVTAGPEDTPTLDKWVGLATGWNRNQEVFAGGAGKLYVVGSEGSLEVQRYTLQKDGTVTLIPRVAADTIGDGMMPWYGLATDVEGYCWPMSVCPGGTVDFMMGVRRSVPVAGVELDPQGPITYSVDVRRLRRLKDGKEGIFDEVLATPISGKTFEAPRYKLRSDWLQKGADWKKSFSLTVPDDWASGIYAVRCSDSNGRDYYVSFVVRPEKPTNALAVIANTNTWNAYNSWGGQGKYTHTHPVPENLPFNRPNPGLSPDVMHPAAMNGKALYGISIHNTTCHLLRAELWTLGWLEDLGAEYAVDHYTDQDLHEGHSGIGDGNKRKYAALILNVHPEYWTTQMYDRVVKFRDQGGSILYLGGNGIYEAVTLSADGRHMGIFPGVDRAKWPRGASNEQIRLHCRMRTPEIGRPEMALIGVGFQNCPGVSVNGQAYELQQQPEAPGSNPVLDGVKLDIGDKIGTRSIEVASGPDVQPADTTRMRTTTPTTHQVNGWEVDGRGNGTPPQAYDPAALLGFGNDGSPSGEMIAYETDAGGQVFAGASLNFGGSLVVDSNLQTIVKNVLDRCLKQ